MLLTVFAGVVLGIFAGLFFGLREFREIVMSLIIGLAAAIVLNVTIASLHLFVGGYVGRIAVTGIVTIVGIFVYSLVVKNKKELVDTVGQS